MKFDGFLKVYEESKEGKDEEDEELKHKLPALEAGQTQFAEDVPPQAAKRLAGTGIDILAVAIGNAHGFYQGEPKLDFGLLEEIASLVSIPLVLHGGTGIPRDQIRRAIGLGIAKINFSALLRRAFISAMQGYLEAEPDTLGVMDVLGAGAAAMRAPVAQCIDLCLSAGHADR